MFKFKDIYIYLLILINWNLKITPSQNLFQNKKNCFEYKYI